MTTHPTAQDLELFVMGAYDGPAAELEAHLADCKTCSATVQREAKLELDLIQLAGSTRACPSCRRSVAAARCESCGCALVAGDYRVLEVVVQNAHGRLYLAEDIDGQRVALKELAFVQAPGADAVAAFEREAKFLRALTHPDIPRFVASFEEGEGVHTRLFLAQEYIEGESLQARLADHWFDEDEVLEIARRTLQILVYLQELSPVVIHGDIKPANLVRRRDGTIALVDFGAARGFGGTITSVVGTFGYMPIEQLAGNVNPTTDLYGLGASLIHLLSREDPWKVFEDPAALGRLNISPELRRFLGRLAARRAADRFPNAKSALEALTRLRAPAGRRRSRWLPAALAAGGLAIGAMGYSVAWLRSDHHRSQSTTTSKQSSALTGANDDFVALLDSDGSASLVSYSLEKGLDTTAQIPLPSLISDAVRDPQTHRWYVIKDSVVGELALPGSFKSLETAAAPYLLSPSAVAFDTKRRRLIVAAGSSAEDTGQYLFVYEVDSERWSVLTNLGGLTIEALAFHPDEDRLYSITDAGLVVTFQADSGALLGVRPAPLPVDPTTAQLAVRSGEVLVAHDGKIEKLAAVTGTYQRPPADDNIEMDEDEDTRSGSAGTPADCNADALKDRGMENVNMGQHAAALMLFEASLRCRQDSYVVSLAFMAACNAQNSPKAKQYYMKLSSAQQLRYQVMCIRNKTSYQ